MKTIATNIGLCLICVLLGAISRKYSLGIWQVWMLPALGFAVIVLLEIEIVVTRKRKTQRGIKNG